MSVRILMFARQCHRLGSALATLALSVSLACTTGQALAQTWPSKPVRIIVPAAPGGSADPLARLVSEELSRVLGQAFVVTTDLIGNRLQLSFPGIAAVVPMVREGRIRALAVMADKRSEVLPEVPSTRELGLPKLVSETWFGLVAPRNAPPEIVGRINEAINTALNTPAFRSRLVSMGYTPMGGSPEQFARLLNDDISKWAEVVKFSGAKID